MRHNKTGKKFGRVSGLRRALLRSLVTSFVVDEKITTTVAKAKALRPYVEKIITHGKESTLVNRRYLQQYLLTEKSVLKVLNDLGLRYKSRKGGYTRVTKLSGARKGDGAEMARLELV